MARTGRSFPARALIKQGLPFSTIQFRGFTAQDAFPGTTISQTINTSGLSNVTIVMYLISGSSLGSGVNAPTFNGVAMTQVGSWVNISGGSGNAQSMWILPNASIGSGLVLQATQTPNVTLAFGATWYSGTSNTQPDNFVGLGQLTGTTVSQSITTVTNNAWVVMMGQQNGALSAGAATTIRQSIIGYIADSNGPVSPAGSRTLTITGGTSGPQTYGLISLVPFVSGNLFVRGLSETYSLIESFTKQAQKSFIETLLSITESFSALNPNGIQFDASAAASGSTGGSANTWSHTCTGSNRLLIVVLTGPPDSGAYSGNAVTYNGISMTEIGHTAVDNGTGDWYVSMWYLLNPASGTNTVSFTGSNNLAGSSASYTGVNQSGQPDGSATANSAGSAVTTKTFTSTVTASNCWQILGFRAMTAGWSAGAGTLLRQNSNNSYNQILDSNGTVGTGSQSLIATGSSDKVGGVIASFAPVGNSYTKALSDAYTLAESFIWSLGRALAETFSVAETFIRSTGLLLAETFSIAEAFQALRTRVANLNDSLTITDTLTRSVGKALTEALSVIEALAKSIGRTLSETFSISEAFQTAKGHFLTVTDSVSITEAFTKLANKILTETISVLESIKRTVGKVLSETLMTISESFSAVKPGLSKAFTESFSLSDVVLKLTTRVFVESLTIAESVKKFLNGVLVFWSTKFSKRNSTYSNKNSPRGTDYSDKYHHMQ